MNSIIKNSLENSLSYQEYSDLVAQYAAEGKTSGNNQTPDYVNYTKLNASRMHRLDKTMQVADNVKSFLGHLTKKYIGLVISETWCGDAAQILPIINAMAKVSNAIDLRIVLRDTHEDLMNLFLTNGTKSIPKLILIDAETNEVVGDFGPRPSGAKQLILDYKSSHGIIDENAKIALQKWYLDDKGASTQKEIIALMK